MRDASLYASRFQASPTDRAPPRAARRGRRSFLGRIFSARGIGATLILSIAAVAAIGVPMNALLLQDGRHPAPLFSAKHSSAAVSAPTPPARPTVKETARTERDANAPARLSPKDAIADRIEKLDGARSADAGKSAEAGKSAPAKADTPRAADKKRDAIGMLILGEAPASKPAPAASVEKPTKAATADKKASFDKNVLYAQRTLVRLGYVVRSDGLLNAATRHAIEKFERDIGLPVKGQVTPKLLRQLAARSRTPLP
ncbi:MAG: peptidoglycan-binding protein [Methylocystis sp.]|uniref:peptidoglycan-binding protein n=1 Tax=Methylocystis sp. TaxID=1911079 RepID=UPI003D0FCBFA